jgi:hypothetical protein
MDFDQNFVVLGDKLGYLLDGQSERRVNHIFHTQLLSFFFLQGCFYPLQSRLLFITNHTIPMIE